MEITHRIENEILICKLTGDMIWENLHTVGRRIIALGKDADYRAVVLDLEEVAYIDSSGIGFLVELYKIVYAKKSKFAIWGMSRQNYDRLVMLRLDKVIDTFNTEQEALAAVTADT